MSVIRRNPPFHPETLLPVKWEYADDGDFADEDEHFLREMFPIIGKEILEQWNLFVNENIAEFIHFYIAGKDELDELLKNKEPWRKAVSLGSRLCSTVDIKHHCILGNDAFEK